MAFPTTPLLDDFNRANEGPPPSANWSTSGELVVNNNACESTQAGIQDCCWLPITGGAVDEAYVTTLTTVEQPSPAIYLFIRVQTINGDDPILRSYGLAINHPDAGTTYIQLLKFNGAVEYLETGDFVWQSGDSFGIEAITSGGTVTLNGYHKPVGDDWTLIVTDTDSLSGGWAGGHVGFALSDATPGTLRLDDFGGGGTLAIPSDPTLLTASAISDTQINLAWSDNSINENGFEIERGTDGVTFALIDTTAADVEAYNDTGLTEATLYYYRVRAVNGDGASGYSNTASATTLNGPLMPPDAPTVLTATPVAIDQINLAWVDNSLYETGFEVERSLTGTDAWVLLATTAAEAEAYQDTTAEQGVTYYYRVRAVNASGNSGYSNTASAKIGDWMITEIANSLIALMEADDDLDGVQLFIEGGTPYPVPQDKTPYSEIIIGEETPVEELTGNVSTRTYRGLITFVVQVTQQALADWLDPLTSDTRRANLVSYRLIKRLVMTAQTELQRYPSLNDLTTTVVLYDQTIREVVTSFRFDGAIVYGLDTRADNYENFGSLSFIVETERTIS